MASTIKKGQSVFIPFVGDASVLDSQNRPRMYKSVEQFKKSYPLFRLEQPELVEYAPVVHGKWIFEKSNDGWINRVCSVCGRICLEEDAPYCYCGAKMEE